MKTNSINNTNFKGYSSALKNTRLSVAKKFAKIDQIGEGTNIALDFFGKAVLVPATIMIASKEPEEKKEYSALKNPIAALFQLMMEVPILMAGSNLVEKLANKGKLDKAGSNFSYNEKLFKEKFISNIENTFQNDKNLKETCANLVEKLNKKGLGKNLKEEFEEIIKKSSPNAKDALKKSLKDFDETHKRLYHLQNRVCFVAAIVLTPILCKAEDYFFPKIMNLIKKPQKQTSTRKTISINSFKAQLAKGEAKW